MGIKLKDFVSTIEIKHTFLNLTISNYFININHIFKPPEAIPGSDRPSYFFFYQAFDLVRQWPHHGLTDRVFFIFLKSFSTKASVAMPWSVRPGFFF